MKNSKLKNENPSTEFRTNSSLGIRVAVGMSGGVDSSVAALLLKEQGYDVVGFFMKLWHDPCGTGENACCDERAEADARAVAAEINIPFYVIDARTPFKKAVTDYFIDEYKNARTPNPCLVCNRKIKFGWLLDFAKKNSCDFLATGHYARVEIKDGVYHLLKPADGMKDQTYFLSGLNQEQLSHVIFPISDLTKEKVRKIAQECKLPVYQKKESQEVCFVEGDYRDFLKNNISADFFTRGKIIDQAGKMIGYHQGLANYTIGQRKGINQSVKDKLKKVMYVTGFDIVNNQIIVGSEEELYKNDMQIKDLSLIEPDIDLSKEDGLSVKIRYRAKEVSCRVEADGNFSKVYFKEPQRAITRGQYAVFYRNDQILGNGIIIG